MLVAGQPSAGERHGHINDGEIVRHIYGRRMRMPRKNGERRKEWRALMELRFPEDLRYSPTHEWVRVEGNRAIIGITDYAQSELGDITYLELPKVGDTVEAGQPFGVVESVKADEELFAPVSGTVVSVNQNAVDHPEIVNQDPYGEGWLIVVEMSDPNELRTLLTAEQYRQMLEREGAI